MQRIMRSVLVAVMVLMMSFNPAVAWHHWGGGWGRGCGARYHGGHRSHGYSSCNRGCGGYGYSRVVYSSEPYCGGCNSGCGSCESCGGGSCGTSDCDSCGGSCSGGSCDGCGSCDGGIVTSGEVTSGEIVTEGTPVYHDTAPTPPSETIMTAPPTTVTKPMQATPPPTLRPTDPMPESTEPPTPPAPSENTETVDPLFGGPETTPPAETAPMETTTPEQPAEEAFGAPPTETPSTETPATEAPATDTPAESADPLFGEPADAGTPPSSTETPPAEGTPPADEPGADFFDAPTETPAEGAMPEGESSSTEKPQKKARTFFASQDVLREPGGLASAEMRQWVDNTGNFSCNGRIVRFMDGYVRLLKDNGRTTTVPLYRLSADDLAFVNRQASAQPQRTIAQAENAGTVESVTAN